MGAREAILDPMMMNVLIGIALLIGLPLLGVIVTGQPVQRYLEFPPQPRSIDPAPFSWPMFFGLALLIMLTVGPLLVRVARSRVVPPAQTPVCAFPWWGWLGALLILCSWVLAWNRFPWFSAFQTHTFTPLWVGYIVVVNAWMFRRTGHCMMRDRPRVFLALFPASAAFWWSFEYLNRFVQNWYYVGPQTFTPTEYFLHATVPFSTVLPAVLGTMELLASVPALRAGLDRLPSVRQPKTNWAGWALLGCASVGLMGIGIWPQTLFPLVWMAPLFLITALQIIGGRETIFSGLSQGDATSLWLAALAALVCGFSWELWNFKSLAHWEYAIPSLHRFKLFEMPLLGYAGYLPFGLECLALTQWLFPSYYREMMSSLLRPGVREQIGKSGGVFAGLFRLGALLALKFIAKFFHRHLELLAKRAAHPRNFRLNLFA
ncbi:MAG TPA: hypothetical protein VJR03_11410 [Nitrospira sp.]|nr:hypothetical protein [Nitrospira sp.]